MVWKYLQEEGLQFAAAALDKETQASRWDTDEAPVGELVKLLLKGQQLASIEETVDRKHRASDLSNVESPVETITGLQPVSLSTPLEGGVAVDSTATSVLLAGFESAQYFSTESQSPAVLDCGDDHPTSAAFVGSELGLIGYTSGALRLWSISESPVLQTILLPESLTAPILLLKLSSSGKLVACTDTKNTLRIWNLETREVVLEHKLSELIEDLVWLGGDLSVAVVSSSRVTVLSINTSESSTDASSADVLEVEHASVAEFNTLSQTLFVGTQLGSISSIALDHSINSWKAHSTQVSALLLLDTKILSASVDGSIAVWDLSTGTPQPTAVTNISDPVLYASADSQLEKVAVITPHGVRILQTKTLEVVGQVKQDGVQSISWLGNALVVASQTKTEFFNLL